MFSHVCYSVAEWECNSFWHMHSRFLNELTCATAACERFYVPLSGLCISSKYVVNTLFLDDFAALRTEAQKLEKGASIYVLLALVASTGKKEAMYKNK